MGIWRVSTNAQHQYTIEDAVGRVIAIIVDDQAVFDFQAMIEKFKDENIDIDY